MKTKQNKEIIKICTALKIDNNNKKYLINNIKEKLINLLIITRNKTIK